MRNFPPFILFSTVFLAVLLGYHFFFSVPDNFPAGTIINIEQGINLHSVSLELKREHIIRSRTAFEAFVIIYGGERHLISADYLFEDREPVYLVARRLIRGESHLAPVKVTIPEGFNIYDIAKTFISRLANFNQDKFLASAKDQEGYLFPDTYFFLTTVDEADVLKAMSNNFLKKITPILPTIISSGKNEKEIIIMASIIEKEAKGDTDRGLISGILWKRLSIGMSLQVDAQPETYKTKGLPQHPISNPGFEAIQAAISPQSSPYLYYLHDKIGHVHFARTFAEHKLNKIKYLK